MRKLAFLPMLLLVFAAGCEDDPPTQPTPNTPTFAMTLLSSNEPSLPAPSEASCAGTVTIRFNITRDASQAITAATADFQANITGCPQGTVITIAHIHRGPAGVNGGIVINTTLAQGDVTLVNGAGSFTKNGVGGAQMTPALTQEILDNPSAFYFNIHSVQNGGGVIRAQLVRTN
jgi:CHRD domain-containing protein